MKGKNKSEKLEKVKIVSMWILSILLIISILQKIGILGDNFKIGKNSTQKLLNNGEMLISEDGVVTKTVNSSNWDTSKVTITKDADGKEVPVPKGYVGSGVTGENKVSGGYVIYEGTGIVNDSNAWSAQTTRNQWVWVPVPYPDRIYEEVNGVKKAKLYTFVESGRSLFENRNYEPAILPEYDNITNLSNGGLTGMTPDKLYQELQLEFDETINSIEKYGGFYIGRYETGNLSQSKPVVMKMNTDIENQNWYQMYNKARYLATNSNVKSNMIWGCLWDETLQYLEDKSNKSYFKFSTYSESWGNYTNSTFTYFTGSQVVTKPVGNVKIPTGSSDYTKSLNIYDLSGNIFECTLEGNGFSTRIARGGCYNNSSTICPTNIRVTDFFNAASSDVGYRAYLYIK